MIRQCIFGAGLLLFVCQGSAQKPSFEVASIRVNTSGSDGGSMGPRGNRLVAENVTLRNLLTYAYSPANGQFLDEQIIGGPDWARTDHFDIEAKAEGNARVVPGEQTKAMLQSLLEDRFQLRAHRETRDLPVYNLVLTKNGPKLSADQTPPDPRRSFISFVSEGQQLSPLPRGALRMVTGPSATTVTGTAIIVPRIVMLLQGKSDRIILDKTGFSGLIDVQLEFSQELGPGESPSLFTATQQIGLKLEPAKAPLEVVVIDSVQHPSQN